MKKLFLLAIGFGLLGCQTTPPEQERVTEAQLTNTLNQLTAHAIANLAVYPIDSTKIPRSVGEDGSLKATGSRDWTSGFYAGTLWLLHRYSGDETLKSAAERWTSFQEKEKVDTHTHDLGFKVFCSFGEGYAVNQSDYYKEVILETSQTLIKRYNPTVGAIRSWDWNKDVWQFPVIIDNMMNLEMLFEATHLSGDSTYFNIANEHALTTLDNHFRDNHSSYHVIDYDTTNGTIRNRHTHQGNDHESSWARGQAWGLYGFTMSYGMTKNPVFLDKAKAIANFVFTHPNMPEDMVPYWDFDAPNLPDEPRDASAGAILASGLLELYQYDETHQTKYLDWADQILTTLSSEAYQSNTAPFLLEHSVGSFPGQFEIDVPLIYADYYYVEALMRRLDIEKKRVKS